jgi:23S rRNA (cytosine1962-C5)-methyltransferase
MIETLTPKFWLDYELIDCGNFLKLERFGKVITIRPEPQAIWKPSQTIEQWRLKANVEFIPNSSSSGQWKKYTATPDVWHIQYKSPEMEKHIQLKLALTAFKHVGVFPEQACNWDFIYNQLSKIRNANSSKFLNLFAYTGAASLVAKQAGADTIHVDSVRQVVNWSNENMKLSSLDNIKWVIEDALKFVKREVKRGNKYNGIILDPPAYGHGPNGEKWKLEDSLQEMISEVLKLLSEENHFLILNCYSLGLSSIIIENLLRPFTLENKNTTLKTGELFLNSSHKNKLPLGVWGRLQNF